MTSADLAARLRAMFAEELDDQVRAATAHLLVLERTPDSADDLRSLFRVMHTLKGAARSAGFLEIERLCHRLEALLAHARDTGNALTRVELDALFAGLDQLAAAQGELRAATPMAESPLDVDAAAPVASAPPARAEAARDNAIRVGQDRIDALFGVSNRLLILAARSEAQPAALERLHDAAVRGAASWRRLRRELDSAANPKSTVVQRDVAALEDAINLLRREIAAALGESMQASRDLHSLARETSLGVRELRMRPFAEAVADLPRLARDVAAATGKMVTLAVSGEDVQADRAVLAQVHDALMHLVRNAIDHGVETPAVRRARGKPDEGTIQIGAALVGDRIVVSVHDDGAGLDSAAIRRKLVANGVEPPADDRAVARLLFQGGLSTRDAATAISGRGVGLDAVRAAADRVRGSVDVDWKRGAGTTFTIEAPLTLATVRAVLTRVGAANVAIPSAFVERLMRVPVEALRMVDGRLAVETSGAPAVVASVAAVLGPPLVERPIERVAHLALVRVGDRRVALRVDELVEEVEVVVRPIRAHGRESVPHISGAAMLPSGMVALVLNVTSATVTALAVATSGAEIVGTHETTVRRKRVLVVDDSITTRTLEASVLEAAGFDVSTAVDGADGWRVLQEQGADLVVSDIEMPRMDGLQLCEAIRASGRFRELPVVLVTALETPEHRARGLEVGADAYLGKSSFEQESLLNTIRDLLG